MRISDWSSDVCSSDLLESGGRMTAQIDWKAPAEYIADGAGTGAFIDKIEAGEARLIAATEADIAAAARLNDMKFLDNSHRMNVCGDVQEIFDRKSTRLYSSH